jgi:hypothetical protein
VIFVSNSKLVSLKLWFYSPTKKPTTITRF